MLAAEKAKEEYTDDVVAEQPGASRVLDNAD